MANRSRLTTPMLRVDLFSQVRSYLCFVCHWVNRRVVDALYYTSTTYKPHTLIDVATLTGFAIRYLNKSTSLIIPLIAPWRLRSAIYFLGCSL